MGQGIEQTVLKRRNINSQQIFKKKCLPFLVIRETQIKTTLKLYLTHSSEYGHHQKTNGDEEARWWWHIPLNPNWQVHL